MISLFKRKEPEHGGHFNGILEVGDIINYYATVNPPWWAFWRKPTQKHALLRLTRVHYRFRTTHYIGELVDQKDVRIKELENALEPFASFAHIAVDPDGWNSSIHKESISTWFGPSQFRFALQIHPVPDPNQ